MTKRVYEKGLVKVVWIKNNSENIYSKMFEWEEDAIKFAQSKKYFLVFKLKNQKEMVDFTWRLLPYGKHKIYSRLVKNLHADKRNILDVLRSILPK